MLNKKPNSLKSVCMDKHYLQDHIVKRIKSISNDNEFLQYCFFTSIIICMIYKIEASETVSVASPVLTGSENTNTIRRFSFCNIKDISSFKNFLDHTKNIIIETYNKNMGRNFEEETDLNSCSLKDIFIQMGTLHHTYEVSLEQYIASILIVNENDSINIICKYDESHTAREYIKAFFSVFDYICDQVLENINIKICDIELINNEQRESLIAFSHGPCVKETNSNTILDAFKKSVELTPNDNAILTTIDIENVYRILYKKENSQSEKREILNYYFEQNEYCFRSLFKNDLIFLKTPSNTCLLLNREASELFDNFRICESVYRAYKNARSQYKNAQISIVDIEESFTDNNNANIMLEFNCTTINGFIAIVKLLYKYEVLNFAGLNYEIICLSASELNNEEYSQNKKTAFSVGKETHITRQNTDIILLGDKPGTAGIGILYLASFLKRNDITAKCHFIDVAWDNKMLYQELNKILDATTPKFVGISMKWFPHIERVYELARVIKDIDSNINICVGGDTASYFCDEVISNQYIDYVICGDGEIPLLYLCQEQKYIPNCLYKRDGKVIKNPITYVQNNENINTDMELYPIDEIVLSAEQLLFTTLYIPTHKGCSFQCIQCGGSKKVQQNVFCRSQTSFWRDGSKVKKDILFLKDFVSTFMFSMDYSRECLFDYCKNILDEINLSKHFCAFFSLELVSKELIHFLCSTFKYVRLNIDICSLSQDHRKRLAANGLVKPQPTDTEIFDFLSECDKYPNCSVDIYSISGMPFYGYEDINSDKTFLNNILSKHICFNDLQWGHLHAQPGATILENIEKHEMTSDAITYDDFLKFSKINMYKKESYPSLMHYNYPQINYKDNKLNFDVMQHFIEMHNEVVKGKQIKKLKELKYGTISYSNLDNISDSISYSMMKSNMKKGDSLVILIKDRILLAAAILASIKSGIAYIPLDHDTPKDRAKNIIYNSNAKVVITDITHDEFSFENTLNVKNINEYHEFISADESELDDLIYIIYTSGSTGVPKGVPIKQKSLINYVKWRIGAYSISNKDITLQLLSESFDGFAANFYMSLLTSTLLIMPALTHMKEYTVIQQIIKEKRISNTSLISGMYNLLLKESNSKLDSLRFVVLAGDKINKNTIHISKKQYPHIMLTNEYGPTENTIATTMYLNVLDEDPNIIGKPISNVNVYILNPENQMMPIGIPGEICISGIGLSNGYINEPELNAQRFVANPFNYESMLYKSGDIGEWREDGNIRFLGRSDRQIKTRGYRVELDDIEKNIFNCYFVDECAVVCKDDPRLGNYICAYIKAAPQFNIEDLKESLSKKLPGYLIPNKIVVLEQLPKTSTGKINYSELQNYQHEYNPIDENEEIVGQTEKTIIELWEKILSTDNIDMNDSFFDIGGNSLLLMDLFMELERLYPLKITITDLFSYTTISKLSKYIDGRLD